MDPIGKVVHYYDHLSVAIVNLEKGSLKVGQQVKFQHGDEKFTQTIESLQVDHKQVNEVKVGDLFGLRVERPTKPGTLVYEI